MRHRILLTPTGPFALCEDEHGDLRTGWVADAADRRLAGSHEDPDLRPALARRLEQYFAGADVTFDDVALPAAATRRGDFSRRCLEACRTIPRGETRTYAELAALAGSGPGAARAAGQAMRHNPLPVIVPCHRVRGAGRDLGGFAGSRATDGPQLGVKRWLLAMEGALAGVVDPQPALPWSGTGDREPAVTAMIMHQEERPCD